MRGVPLLAILVGAAVAALRPIIQAVLIGRASLMRAE